MRGVAISTTGDRHRLATLVKCVDAWQPLIEYEGLLVVTVDGGLDAVRRVDAALRGKAAIYQVGQPGEGWAARKIPASGGRLGVAANKNTGLELLMEYDVDHLWLCDDDAWPRHEQALSAHEILRGVPHSMVCWGRGRLAHVRASHAEWTWPRGVAIYSHVDVIEKAGGMVEAFGPGGHEHAEWSRRIHQMGLTPAQFCSPHRHARNGARGAEDWWECIDIPHPRESPVSFTRRKKAFTSVRTADRDWGRIKKLMRDLDGKPQFVDYTAASNDRLEPLSNVELFDRKDG